MDRQLLDTALRNVAARKGQSYCLYLNKHSIFGVINENGNFVLDYDGMAQEFGEEVKLLEIELAELQYDKHQQDKIDIGEPNVNNENEVL
tara:strand:+ start:2161 stop:2430 length:270 start_codon:yes stop_codon:yes gene_type:complete